jgi:hypothetical protein
MKLGQGPFSSSSSIGVTCAFLAILNLYPCVVCKIFGYSRLRKSVFRLGAILSWNLTELLAQIVSLFD